MIGIEINIVAFVDNSQPGWVECIFEDVHGKQWTIIEKVPIVSDKDLDEDTDYPRKGFAAGMIKSAKKDSNNREVVTIDTSSPWGISADTGETEFEVFREQIVDIHFT